MGHRRVGFITAALVAALLGGCAFLPRGARKSTVVFDEAHGERFLVGAEGPLDLSKLGAIVRGEGLAVRTNRDKIDDATLAKVDALVVSGPFMLITPWEVDAIVRFVQGGGRLALMLHVGLPAALLLDALHVASSNGVIRERENTVGDEPLNFRVTRFAPHALTRDLPGFNTYGSWALMSRDDSSAIIARTSDSAWVDLNNNKTLDDKDAVQSFGVIVAGTRGKGAFVVFGDDAVFQNEFLVDDNVVLARNLARWLVRQP